MHFITHPIHRCFCFQGKKFAKSIRIHFRIIVKIDSEQLTRANEKSQQRRMSERERGRRKQFKVVAEHCVYFSGSHCWQFNWLSIISVRCFQPPKNYLKRLRSFRCSRMDGWVAWLVVVHRERAVCHLQTMNILPSTNRMSLSPYVCSLARATNVFVYMRSTS